MWERFAGTGNSRTSYWQGQVRFWHNVSVFSKPLTSEASRSRPDERPRNRFHHVKCEQSLDNAERSSQLRRPFGWTPKQRELSDRDANSAVQGSVTPGPRKHSGYGRGTAPPSILASLASFSRNSELSVVSITTCPQSSIYRSVQGRDLGGVSRDIFLDSGRKPKGSSPGSQIIVRGQIQTMKSSFLGLLTGSYSPSFWLPPYCREFSILARPFIILTALPATLAESFGFCLQPARRSACPHLRDRSCALE